MTGEAPTPPRWMIPSAGAVPGAPSPSGHHRFQALGTTALVLGILETIHGAWGIFGSLLSLAMFAWQQRQLPAGPGPGSAAFQDLFQEQAQVMTAWTIAREVPFLVASLWLVVLALRLRGGDEAALGRLKIWCYAALGVVGLSVVIQVVAVLPQIASYQQAMFDAVPAGAPGLGQAMGPFVSVATAVSVFLGAIFMAAWPVVLWIWIDKLARAARA